MSKKAKKFLLFTFLASYLYAAFFYYVVGVGNQYVYLAMAMGYMWIPGIVALLLMKQEKTSFKQAAIIFRPNKWFAFAWIIFIILVYITIPINSLFPSAEFSLYMEDMLANYQGMLSEADYQEMYEQITAKPWLIIIITLAQALLAGITINAFFALGEELGWRGYLYDNLAELGFWKNSVYTGFFWGLWHAPIIMQGHNYPGYPIVGIFMMIAWCILLSPLFTLIRQKSGSVVAAAIAHGTLNAIAGVGIMYMNGGHVLLNGLLGFSGFIVLAVVNIIIWLYVSRQSGSEASYG